MKEKVNLNYFQKRLDRFMNHWKENPSIWNDVEHILVMSGELKDFNFISVFHSWLFEWEFSNTYILFDKKGGLMVFTSKKKGEILSSLKDVKVTLDKKEFLNNLPKEIGIYTDVKENEMKGIDVSKGIEDLLSVKDTEEIENIKKSSKLCVEMIEKYFQPEIEEMIINDKKMTHLKLGEMIEKKINERELEACCPPIIHSGKNIELNIFKNDENIITFDTIVFSIGMKYEQYCSFLSRTYLVDCSQEIEDNYNFLLELFKFMIGEFKINLKLKDIYGKVKERIQEKKPELLNSFIKNFGCGIGLEMKEKYLEINEMNEYQIKKGNVFNIQLGFQIESSCLFISDTILMNENSVELLTNHNKEFSEIFYSIEEEEKIQDEIKDLDQGNIIENSKRQIESSEDKRKIQQQELLKKKREEKKIIQKGGDEKKYSMDDGLSKGTIISYSNFNEIPIKKNNQIYIDDKKQNILIHLNYQHIPFHVSTIKNISKSDEGEYIVLRINFKNPQMVGQIYTPVKDHPKCLFLKEISIRSKDTNNILSFIKQLTLLKKKVSDKERDVIEQQGLVVQEPIKIKGQSNIRLRDVYVRPNPKGKKTLGKIEAHENGLRFSSNKGDTIDILYSNIKHAFYQQAKDEIIVLVHFHLYHPIMIGKKKHQDIQFYTEVMEEVDQLVGNKRKNLNDQESIAEENREQLLRQKLNKEFLAFSKKVEEKSGIEFDIPYFELGFVGTPNRSAVKLIPTVFCLVNLTDMPFTVITLSDIELAYFERVSFGMKNFDLILVFKDYNRPVVTINAIPTKTIDTIKDWLTQVEIKYFEGIGSLVWPKILKTIREDDEWSPWGEDGWNSILNTDEDQGGQEEMIEEEEEEEYREDTESDEEEEDAYEEEDDEDEFVGEEELSDDEKGLSWEELEKKAENHDNEKELSDDESPVKKKKKK